jgi:hypothetical protein
MVFRLLFLVLLSLISTPVLAEGTSRPPRGFIELYRFVDSDVSLGFVYQTIKINEHRYLRPKFLFWSGEGSENPGAIPLPIGRFRDTPKHLVVSVSPSLDGDHNDRHIFQDTGPGKRQVARRTYGHRKGADAAGALAWIGLGWVDQDEDLQKPSKVNESLVFSRDQLPNWVDSKMSDLLNQHENLFLGSDVYVENGTLQNLVEFRLLALDQTIKNVPQRTHYLLSGMGRVLEVGTTGVARGASIMTGLTGRLTKPSDGSVDLLISEEARVEKIGYIKGPADHEATSEIAYAAPASLSEYLLELATLQVPYFLGTLDQQVQIAKAAPLGSKEAVDAMFHAIETLRQLKIIETNLAIEFDELELKVLAHTLANGPMLHSEYGVSDVIALLARLIDSGASARIQSGHSPFSSTFKIKLIESSVCHLYWQSDEERQLIENYYQIKSQQLLSSQSPQPPGI